MESFRKVIKGWLGIVLLILFLTPLALVGIEGYFSGGNKENVAATVNGQEISKKELESLTKSYKEQYLNFVNGDETLLNQPFIQQTALDHLIAQNLILQQAEKVGISLSDAQIEQMLAQQPSFQQNGQFSQTLYENYLRSVGLTSQGLIANLRQDHALKMLNSTFVDYTLVSKVDMNQIANLQTEQRTLFLSSIPLDEYKKNIQVSQQDIANYYQKHKNSFKQTAHVDVDYIVLSPEQVNAKAAPVTGAELQQAYANFVEAQNKNAQREVKHILIATSDTRNETQAQKLANEVYAKIQGGMNFAQAAAQYSDDIDSKTKGGLIESYQTGVYSEAFDKAVLGLKANQISQPVKTQYGYHIIQAQTLAQNIPSFEAEKSRLAAEIQKSKVANLFTDTVNSLNEMVVSSDSLDVVPQEIKGTRIETVKNVGLNTRHPVLNDPSVKARIFNEDVKNGDRNVTSNLQLATGEAVWVKVRDYQPEGVQSLAQATPAIKTKIIDEKAAGLAAAKLKTMLDEFKTQPAQQVLAKHKVAFQSAGTFTRSQGLKRDVERAAFSVAAPKSGMWSVTTAALPNELVLVAVANVNKTTSNALTPEQLQELSKLYQQLRGQQELEDYTQYLKSKAKIK